MNQIKASEKNTKVISQFYWLVEVQQYDATN